MTPPGAPQRDRGRHRQRRHSEHRVVQGDTARRGQHEPSDRARHTRLVPDQHVLGQLGQAEREHREVRAAEAEGEGADHEGQRGRRAGAGQHGERPCPAAQHQRGRVGPGPEEGARGERQVARRPREERPGHRERHVGEDREQERAVVWPERERRRRPGRAHGRCPEPCPVATSVPRQRLVACPRPLPDRERQTTAGLLIQGASGQGGRRAGGRGSATGPRRTRSPGRPRRRSARSPSPPVRGAGRRRGSRGRCRARPG